MLMLLANVLSRVNFGYRWRNNWKYREIDYEGIARTVIKNIGYHDEESGINPDTCQIIVKIQEQSADIALGVKLRTMKSGLAIRVPCMALLSLKPQPICHCLSILPMN